jgi:DNA-binding CsgD family transcriptional regulator
MAAQQRRLLEFLPPPPGTVVVNDRVSIRTEGNHRAIFLHGLVLMHYDVSDQAAEECAMVTLFEAGYASQKDIARAFGYTPRSLRRYQERIESGGLSALGRPRGRPSYKGTPRIEGRDRTILRLKERGLSNRAIAVRLGFSEKVIRKRLRRLGWKAQPAIGLQFEGMTDDAIPPTRLLSDRIGPPTLATAAIADTATADEPLPVSFDRNPLNRSLDRLLAAMGKLEDAAPLFARTENLPGAGVLLAIPALVESGLLAVARRIYGSLGPAFYGLRTTIVALVLLALLRIPRPEALKEHSPGDLGRIVGLDRMLEVKTLRRKFARLAAMKRGREFGLELARRRIAERGRTLGFLYIDGHVRAYHGKHTIPKAYVTRSRIAAPATTDYWINDPKGDPLFVVTADANAAMTRILVPILKQVRNLIGPDRRLTVVFDRGGWSPRLFLTILDMGFDILTYRKGGFRKVSEKRFVLRKAKSEGRHLEYLLHDQPVRFLKGKLRLRQVTHLTETSHQTAVLTSRWDLRDIVVAYRMFDRWRQENFFKYMRQEFLIDALVDYEAEPDDPNRSIPNPARKVVDKELRKARSHLARLQEQYGSAALDYLEGRTPTMRAFTAAEREIHRKLGEASAEIARLIERQKSLPTRIPLSESPEAENAMKLSTERKHLSNILKMVAYQIEGSLVELLRPVYPRTEDEGRTLIQTALRNAATIEPTKEELRVTLAPLSSPHRSRAIAAVCDVLNKTETRFPGTKLRIRFAMAEPPI